MEERRRPDPSKIPRGLRLQTAEAKICDASEAALMERDTLLFPKDIVIGTGGKTQ